MTRLQDGGHAPREIMRRALDLGRVMALTRNENGVIETTGVASRLKEEERQLATADAAGNAVHKLYLKNDAAIPVFDRLAADFRNPDQGAALQVAPAAPKPAARPDGEIDVADSARPGKR